LSETDVLIYVITIQNNRNPHCYKHLHKQ